MNTVARRFLQVPQGLWQRALRMGQHILNGLLSQVQRLRDGAV
jgi:hypothetical protein